MPFERCEEEARYVRRVADLSGALLPSTELVDPDLELCVFARSLDYALFAGEGVWLAQHRLPDLDTE